MSGGWKLWKQASPKPKKTDGTVRTWRAIATQGDGMKVAALAEDTPNFANILLHAKTPRLKALISKS